MEDFRLVVMQFKLRNVVVQENFRLVLFKTNKESLFAEQGRCTKRSVNCICSFYGFQWKKYIDLV